MKCALSKLPAPVLAGVVKEKNTAAALAEIKNCLYNGAGMIDLHLSCLQDTNTDTLRQIVSGSKLPILALNYNQGYDCQNAGFSEEDRVKSLLRAVEAGAAGIDMQGYTFDLPSKDAFYGEDIHSFTKGGPKEVVTASSIIEKQCELIEQVHFAGAEVLLSCHPGIAMSCEQVVDLALFLEKRNPDIIKIVTIATNEEELIESFKTMLALKKEIRTTVSYHAAGPCGSLSRIINPMLGSHIMFCVDRFNERSTLEQLDLKTAKTAVDSLSKIL